MSGEELDALFARVRERMENARPPIGEGELAAVEAGLGFALPDQLRRFYREVADGVRCLGLELLSAEEALATYQRRRGDGGPRGEQWPAGLLSVHANTDFDECIQAEDGVMILFDFDLVRQYSRRWNQAFKPLAPSFAAYLESWLASPDEEEMKALVAAEGARIREASLQLQIERIAAMSEEERRALGLAEDWEAELRGMWA